jgi:hypothetical protein
MSRDSRHAGFLAAITSIVRAPGPTRTPQRIETRDELDLPAPPRKHRPRLRYFRYTGFAVFVVAVAVALGAVGYISAEKQHAQYAASSYIVLNGNSLDNASAYPLTPDQANRFVQTQIFPFTTLAFKDEVARHLRTNDPFTLGIQQVGITDVVAVTASAATRHDAVVASVTATRDMVALISTTLAAPLTSERNALKHQLATLAKSSARPKGVTDTVNDQALSNVYQKYLGLENSIAMAKQSASPTARVLKLSTADNSGRAVSPSRRALIYGLGGAIIAVLAAIYLSRRWSRPVLPPRPRNGPEAR